MLLVSNCIIVRIIISWDFLTSEFAGSMMGPVGEKRQFWVYKLQFGSSVRNDIGFLVQLQSLRFWVFLKFVIGRIIVIRWPVGY